MLDNEKQIHPQLELFKLEDRSEKKLAENFSLLTYVHGYEKVILLVIGFMVTGIICFCLGVEKGKLISSVKTNQRFDLSSTYQAPRPNEGNTEIRTNKIKPQPQAINPKPSQEKAAPVIKQDDAQLGQPEGELFTVQVASFYTRNNAELESQRLRRKGFNPIIITKGNFSVVCVGNFQDEEKAKSLLSKLRESYKDCLLRRL